MKWVERCKRTTACSHGNFLETQIRNQNPVKDLLQWSHQLLEDGKGPGADGIPVDFYLTFLSRNPTGRFNLLLALYLPHESSHIKELKANYMTV